MAGLPPARWKEEPGTAQGVALGTHGDWDSASTWPLTCPRWSQAPRRTQASLTVGTGGCVSPALLRFPPLCSSKAPAPRVSVTAEGSTSSTGLEDHYQEKKNRFTSSYGQQSPGLGAEFGMVEFRDANPKPSLGSTGSAVCILQVPPLPTLPPRASRSQQRRTPQLPVALTSHCWIFNLTSITFLLAGGQCWTFIRPRSACKGKTPATQASLGARIFRMQRC